MSLSTSRSRRARRAALATAAAVAVLAGVGGRADAHGSGHDDGARTVYTLSNAAAGNEVLAFVPGAGGLVAAGHTASGGQGTGGGLGSQGALALDEDGRRLVVVNAGSDDLSLFAVRKDGSLRLLDRVASGGDKPVSVAVHDDTVYALNSGDDTISGFRLRDRSLQAIAGSTRHLSGSGGAQVSFTSSGRQLVVTEKATNTIDVFPVERGGTPGAPRSNASVGATPFGFAFDEHNHLIVSNAAGGAAGASSVSSYTVRRDGSLKVLDGPVATTQSAACWVAIAGPYAYTTNTASGTVSGLRLGENGALSLLDPSGVAAATGTTPIDAATAGGSLYTLNTGSHTITVHAIAADGSLSAQGAATGLPTGAVGLAVR